jgi:hypothetical protein
MVEIGHGVGEQAKQNLNIWLRTEIYHLIVFLLLVSIVGCTPVPPKVVNIEKDQSFRPSTPDDVKNIDQSIAAVITAATDVGLPAVDYLRLWLYQNTESFTYWGGWRNPMAHVADATAFTVRRDIHVNLEKLKGREWDEQVAVLAHEYGHAVQFTLGSRDRAGVACWFDEGFAEWVRARILDSLMWRNNEVAVRRARRELNYHQEFNLSALQDSEGWAVQRRKPGGWVKTYVAAFTAVDQLIKVRGFAAAVEYLKTGEFEQSFGEAQSDFEAALKESIIQAPRNKSAQFFIPRPEWKVGYSWSYEEKRSGRMLTTVKDAEIVGTDSTSKSAVFLVKERNEEISRSMETLGVLETRKNGVVTTRRDKTSQIIAWPLQPSKEWRNIYTLENLETKQTYKVDRVMVVSGIEEVKVPSGTFKAIKIEGYDYQTGRLQAEYWYSSEVKWFVRTINYGAAGTNVRERQLISAKIHS